MSDRDYVLLLGYRVVSSGVFVHVNKMDQFLWQPFCLGQSEGTAETQHFTSCLNI